MSPSLNIVLIHGRGGSSDAWEQSARHLSDLGHKVRVMQLPMSGTMDERSSRLVEEIKNHFSEEAPLHLMGHSSGGLLARDIAKAKAIDEHGLVVKSVTTLGTPHHGARDATLLNLVTFGKAGMFGMLKDKTFDRIKKFNQETPDNENVLYLSWAGMRDTSVSVTSARWGKFLGTYNVNHADLPRTVEIVLETLPILQEANKRSPDFCAHIVNEVQTRRRTVDTSGKIQAFYSQAAADACRVMNSLLT